MRFRTLIGRVCAVLSFALLASCRGGFTDGGGLCNLMGPCNTAPVHDLDAFFIVGYPDSLVSKDPADQVGVLTVGDTVVLRYVQVSTADVPFGQSIYASACTQATVPEAALHWAVSDSTVAAARSLAAGVGVIRARGPGRFNALTITSAKPPSNPEFWVPYIVACPSGRVLGPIVVDPAR